MVKHGSASVSRRTFLTAVAGSAALIPDAVAFTGSAPFETRPSYPEFDDDRVSCAFSIFDFLDDRTKSSVLRNDYSELGGVSAYVQRAVDAADGRVVKFGAGVFRLESPVWLPQNCHLDLGEASIQVVGDTLGLVSRPAADALEFVVISGAQIGARSLFVDGAAGIQVGHWGYLRGDSAQGNRNVRAPAWGRVEEVHGNEVIFDRALQVDCQSGCQLVVVPKLHQRFSLRNGEMDGSLNRHERATGQAVRVTGYESVVIDNVKFSHFDHGGTLTSAVQVFECLDVSVRHCNFTDGVSDNNMVDLQTARHVEFFGNLIVGDHFGVNITRADYGKAIGNTVVGRRKKSADRGILQARSVRGIKFYGCGHALVSQNHCADFESPIKIEACMRFMVDGNYVINAGLDSVTGQIALNIGSQNPDSNMHSGVVTGNIVENCGGSGIGITSDMTGRVVVSNNVILNCGTHGIYVAVDSCIVTGNQISNWDLLGRNYAGIAATTNGAQIIKDNFFHHDKSPHACCTSVRGSGSLVTGNLCTSGNQICQLRD